jgi:spore germination protein GerM
MPRSKKGKPKKRTTRKKTKKARSFLPYLLLLILVIVSGIIFFSFNKKLLEKINLPKRFTVQTWNATLYFGDARDDYLVREYRKVSSAMMPEKMGAALMHELILGPYAGGIRVIPEGTKVQSIKMENEGLAKIDFSSEMISFHPGGSSAELMTVYSIVNTLTANISAVKQVQLLINGEEVETIAGHIDCSDPIYPKPELVR